MPPGPWRAQRGRQRRGFSLTLTLSLRREQKRKESYCSATRGLDALGLFIFPFSCGIRSFPAVEEARRAGARARGGRGRASTRTRDEAPAVADKGNIKGVEVCKQFDLMRWWWRARRRSGDERVAADSAKGKSTLQLLTRLPFPPSPPFYFPFIIKSPSLRGAARTA